MTTGPWPALGRSYDAVASAYEARFVDELDTKPRDRELLTAFGAALPEDGIVLDVGCGPGQVGAFVRRGGAPSPVVGVDLSASMARLAAERLDAALVADVRHLPWATGQVGGIVAFYSLIHVRRHELGDAVRELARVLRPGGRVLASFHEGVGEARIDEFLGQTVTVAATFFGLDEVASAFEAGGLRVDLRERRPPYASEGDTTRLYVGAAKLG